MLTRQEHVTQMSSTPPALKDIVLGIAKTKIIRLNLSSFAQFNLKNLFKKIILISSEIITFSVVTISTTHAEVRWYRYYDSRGVPTISSAVSEQHLQQGYDVLDSHMQLIRHYQPFSADKYAQLQVLREQAIAKRISDRHLQETYISSSHAMTQRDRELNNLDGQIQRSETESKHLSDDLNASITSAAGYDRQNKPIPATLKAEIDKNKGLVSQSNANLAALKAKREQTNKQFNDVIAQLKTIEAQSGKPETPNTP